MRRALPALVLAALAVALYLPTWSPVGTWAHFGEDGPELEAAGRTLGIPHPTGYPLLMLLVRVTGLAVPPPRSALNVITLLAAVAAVVAAGFAGRQVAEAAFARRVSTAPPTWPSRSPHPRWMGWTAGLLAGAFFATSLTWWNQAVIGEVYTLHLAFLALALAIAFSGETRPSLALAYVLGIGLAHHLQTLVLLAVVLVYFALRGRLQSEPVRAGRIRVRLLPGLATLAVFLLPISLYFVLLIRSRLDPPMDWGDPETFTKLWWMMSGTPYRANLFRDGVLPFIYQWVDILRHGPASQLGWVGAGLAAAGSAVIARRAPAEGAALTLLYLGSTFVAAAYAIPDPAAYILPAILALALGAGVGGAWLLAHASRALKAFAAGPAPNPWRLAPPAAAAALIAAGLLSQVAIVGKEADASRDRTGYDYAREAIAALPPGALVISHGDGRTFSLWLGAEVLSPRPDIAILYDNLLEWPWYRGVVERQHPDVILPPNGLPRSFRRGALIMTHLDDRPVYVTELEPELASIFTAEPAGPLFRVDRRPPADSGGRARDLVSRLDHASTSD